MAELHLINVSPPTFQMLSVFGDQVEKHAGSLIPFDTILSEKDWGQKWSEVLLQSETVADVSRAIASKTKVPASAETDGDQSKAAAAFLQLRQSSAGGLKSEKSDKGTKAPGSGPPGVALSKLYVFLVPQYCC